MKRTAMIIISLVVGVVVFGLFWTIYRYMNDDQNGVGQDMDYQWALGILTKHGKTFRYVLNFFPISKRKYIVCYYAYCRITDDMIDNSNNSEQKLKILQDYYQKVYEYWEQFVDASQDRRQILFTESKQRVKDFLKSQKLSNNESRGLEIFHQIVYEKQIDKKYSYLLIKGYAQDVKNKEIKTSEDLVRYSVYVAGSVGMVVCLLFDIRDPETLEKAKIYGSALQITNISRDILTDAEMQKVYVPTEFLTHENVSRKKFLEICKYQDRPINNQQILRLSKRLVNLAENYYIVGASGTAGRPWGIKLIFFLVGIVYRQIGIKILNQDKYIKRTHTSKWEKLLTVIKSPYYYGSWVVIGTDRIALMPIKY